MACGRIHKNTEIKKKKSIITKLVEVNNNNKMYANFI